MPRRPGPFEEPAWRRGGAASTEADVMAAMCDKRRGDTAR